MFIDELKIITITTIVFALISKYKKPPKDEPRIYHTCAIRRETYETYAQVKLRKLITVICQQVCTMVGLNYC